MTGGPGFINDFMFFVALPHEEDGCFTLCCGANVTRFLPLTGGRHGIGGSPVMRGLQSVLRDAKTYAIDKGATTNTMKGSPCSGLAPTPETWYTISVRFDNCDASLSEYLVSFCPKDFLKNILLGCRIPDDGISERLQSPDEMRSFIGELIRSHSV